MKKTFILAAAFFVASNAYAGGVFSGPYAGINVGWSHAGFHDSGYGSFPCPAGNCYDSTYAASLGSPDMTDNGFTGGGQVGYNWQNGQYVWGLEADINSSSHKVTHNIFDLDGDGTVWGSTTTKMDSFATVRARAGYAFLQNLMVYVTAGPAVSHGSSNLINTNNVTLTAPEFNSNYGFGWAAGAGAEYKVTDAIGVRGEYLHVQTTSRFDPSNPSWNYGTHNVADQDIIRVGLNYFFDPAAANAAAGASNVSNKGAFSGPYAGVNVGWSHAGFHDSGFGAFPCAAGNCYDSLNRGSLVSPDMTDNGVTGGGQVGYNWQNGQYVWGLEADLNSSSHKVTHNTADFDGDGTLWGSSTTKMDSFGTVRARAGYAFLQSLMAYITAGPAVSYGVANLINTHNPTYTAPGFNSSYGFGWSAGAGAEYKVTDAIGVRGEYLHVRTTAHFDPSNPNWNYAIHSVADQDIVRVGANYYFR